MADRSNGYATGRMRRERILDAAVTAFGQSGFRTATLADIAKACGISRPGLLHHFESKEALLTAVLARRDQADSDAFEAAIARSTSPLQALVDIAADNEKSAGLTELYAMLSAEATNPEHPAHEYFVTLYARLRRELASAFARMQAVGELDAEIEAVELANELLALKDGLSLQALLQPEALRPADALATAIKRLTGIAVAVKA